MISMELLSFCKVLTLQFCDISKSIIARNLKLYKLIEYNELLPCHMISLVSAFENFVTAIL